MNFVEDDQPILVGVEKQRRISQLRPIGAAFQIQVERVPFVCELDGKRRLADLSRTRQSNGGLSRKGPLDRR